MNTIRTITGQFQEPMIPRCSVFLPRKLKTDFFLIVSCSQQTKFFDFRQFEQIFSQYFLKFIAGDKNTVSGFADIAIDELYLWDNAKIGKSPFVKQVCNAVRRFHTGLSGLTDLRRLNTEKLIVINTELRPKMRNYGIRTKGMKAGNPKTNPYAFYCIPPEIVREYLHDLIGFINSDAENDINKALIVLQQFIFIHPFRDGNGRMSRLLLLKIMQEKYGLIYSCLLSIYLKNINRDNYHKAVNQFQNNNVSALQEFYDKAIEWTNQSAKMLGSFIEEYTNKAMQHNIDSDSHYKQIVIKTDVNHKVDESVFQLYSKKAGKNIYINTALLNVLNQFDYYLRYELRKHQGN